MIYSVWYMIFLAMCAIIDLKERKIYLKFCFVNTVLALLLHIICKDIEWVYVVSGMGLGGLLFLVSVVTKEALGKGDAVIIFTLGSIIGIKISLEILIWSLVSCSVISVIGILLKKRKLNSSMPFAPFLLLGGIMTILI